MDECDGLCASTTPEECQPPIVPVEIVGGRFSGWSFDYCQRAIQEDRDRGFTVKVVERQKDTP